MLTIAFVQKTTAQAPKDPLYIDLSKTIAFVMGQRFNLNRINDEYPALSLQVQKANHEFKYAFGTAEENIQKALRDIFKDKYSEFVVSTEIQIKSILMSQKISKEIAIQFLDEVESRSKGRIPSPILETLLSYQFEDRPVDEFSRGFKTIYRTKGHPKAKGLDVQIEYPKSWKPREGKRPHVVQFFRSQNGHGAVMMSLLIQSLPDEVAKELTNKDLKTLFADKNEIESMAPEGAKVLNSKSIVLDNQNGAMLVLEIEKQRLDLKQKMLSHQYMTMYDKKFIILNLAVRDTKGDTEGLNEIFQKHKKLFWLIANSLIIQNQYFKY